MGKTIEKIAIERGHEIVSIIDIDNRDDFDSEAFRSADVAIEFTAPTVAYDNCKRAMAAGVKVVSGSTGWYQQNEAEMRSLCEQEGKTLFWSSNFSLGVAIFSAVNRYLAKIMNNFPTYDVAMEETHHIHKLDAPSGTAITLAEGILENLGRKSSWVMGDLTNPDGSTTAGAAPKADELKIDAICKEPQRLCSWCSNCRRVCKQPQRPAWNEQPFRLLVKTENEKTNQKGLYPFEHSARPLHSLSCVGEKLDGDNCYTIHN